MPELIIAHSLLEYFNRHLFISILIFSGQVNAQVNNQEKFPVGKWVSLFNGVDTKDWTVKIHHHEIGVNFGNTFQGS